MNYQGDIQSLFAQWLCRQVVVQTAFAVDDRDFSGFAGLFTINGVLVRPDGSRLQGRGAIEKAYAQRDPDRMTRHQITSHLLTLRDSTHLVSRCNVLLWSGRYSDNAAPTGLPADTPQMVGEFLDELELTDEGWRISLRQASFALSRAS